MPPSLPKVRLFLTNFQPGIDEEQLPEQVVTGGVGEEYFYL
jgi:hypothetical protein